MDCSKQLTAAKEALAVNQALQSELAKARKKTTIRQAQKQKSEAEHQARLLARDSGKIDDLSSWNDQLKQADPCRLSAHQPLLSS